MRRAAYATKCEDFSGCPGQGIHGDYCQGVISDGHCSLASFEMQTTYPLSPSFPPADALISAIARADWGAIMRRTITAAMIAAAICQTMATRAWQHRGRLAPILRKAAALLIAAADRLPEPLSASSPRGALIAAMVANGANRATLSKMGTPALVRKAAAAGLF